MPHPPYGLPDSRHPHFQHLSHFQRLGQMLSRHRLLVGAKALLIMAVAIGAFSGCRATGGGIPGIEPPNAPRTVPAAPASPSPTAASPSSVPAATPKSGQGQNEGGINTSLAKNSIYAVDLGNAQISCKIKVRSPKPPLLDNNLGS